MYVKKGVKLHVVIILLILFIVISTVAINWTVSMNAHKKSITEDHLDGNFNYAKKLTSSTDYQLDYMQKNMIAIGNVAGNTTLQQEDLDNFYRANKDQFNVIFIVDTDGKVEIMSPELVKYGQGTLITKGTLLNSDMIQQALADKKPEISEPYRGTSGQLLTLISAPIFDQETKSYEGLIGGAIDMDRANVLKGILGTHEYDDQSYVYVVDSEGRIIYHPNADRIGDDVSSNEIVTQVLLENEGTMISKNLAGEEFFAGYAYVESTGWGIVVQTPTSIVAKMQKTLFWRMVVISIPFLILILLISGVVISLITRPLNKLAHYSENSLKKEKEYVDGNYLHIESPIYEVRQLYVQVLEYLKVLNKEVRIDGLTQLNNRKTFDLALESYVKEGFLFSMIMIDIDYFKEINDTSGHIVGDQV